MHTKKITGVMLMILFFGTLPAGAVQDPKAREILDKLAEKTTSAPSISVDFTISMESQRDDISEEFDGRITLRDEKYRLSIMDTEIWFDGKSVYTYLPQVNEAIISDPDEDGGLMSNPTEIFRIYHEEFRYRLQGELTRDGKRLYEIDLHPLDTDQNFHTVKLFIERDSFFINSAVVAGKDGNRYILVVNGYDNTRKVPDSHFVFNKSDYPGVEIIDMRW
jgi:outer membrane lipoprotein-sorting protein